LRQDTEHNFVELLQKHQNIVHKICRIYTDNEHAHKDLFQEISIQLWKAFPKFRGDSKFSTWMYRVGLNTAITLYRKSLRTIKSQPIESVGYKLSHEDYDNTKDEQLKLIYEAVKKLNDIDKGIIFLIS
jgi:RNA polymerase sigma-70 factor (ECF subfamily)